MQGRLLEESTLNINYLGLIVGSCSLKIFRILAQSYRNRRRRYRAFLFKQ
ncbi:MAG: hypothetical protein ACRC1Z_06575 [Waterburya sp.]